MSKYVKNQNYTFYMSPNPSPCKIDVNMLIPLFLRNMPSVSYII